MMNRILPLVVALSAATPLAAQDVPIYGPCTLNHAPADEAGFPAALVAAMEAAGWTHLTTDEEVAAAIPSLADIAGLVYLPSRFTSLAEAEDYAARSRQQYEPGVQFSEHFTRDGLYASVASVEMEPGKITTRCFFAGLEVPGVAEALSEEDVSDERLAAHTTFSRPEVPEGGTALIVVTFQFQGAPEVLAAISGREGYQISYEYEVPE